ncbi:hypothetical protein COB52_01590 [Candidatus Kaiserbacteria bacterium]|nr:MAG: hypothetical protein COB52_01590 [Candidatus Kaiserbacteria bacterium]
MDPEKIEEIFFEAMQQGFVADFKGKPTRNMPSGKQIASRFGDWKVTDLWITNPTSRKSAGMTTIFYKRTPVWSMSYEGWYEVGALLLLKPALRKAYGKSEFYGCRAEDFYSTATGVRYSNIFSGNFSSFFGQERMVHRMEPETALGKHTYRGGLLI